MSNNYQFSAITKENKVHFQTIERFLSQNNLDVDDDVEQFLVGWRDNQIVACGGIAGNVLKCIAIDPLYRGDGLSLKLLTELINMAYDLGRTQLFLFTKSQNEILFSGAGFYTIAKIVDHFVLMENSPNRLAKYCKQLALARHQGKKIGSIVMNANPFTLGHRYLIEQASQQCDWLHLFVVKENVSQFSYRDRFQLIHAGIKEISHVTLHEGCDYIISRATFPSYFTKDKGIVNRYHTEIDLQLFRHYLAPALNITHRFVGTEPYDKVTQDYNFQMKNLLSLPKKDEAPIDVIELSRLVIDGQVVSASRVRSLLAQKDWEQIMKLVPPTTLAFLKSRTGSE